LIRPEAVPAGSQQNGDKVKRYLLKPVIVIALAMSLGAGVSAQTIYPTPYFTSFADTLIASTFNGQPLVVGSIIQAYDPSGTYCGVDTVRDGGGGQAIFGYFSVYGDDAGTAGLDEGAVAGEHITFKINGRTATVTQGDDVWADQSLKSVTLSASATIAITGINYQADTLVMPGDTQTFRVDVRNDGNGTDFYGVKMSMSHVSGTGNFDWESFEPDSVVYAGVGETVAVYFSARAPIFGTPDDTVNTISYTVFSELDTTVTVTGSFDQTMTVTDVDDDGVALPGTFALYQNYPNPFNPITSIAYQLPSGSSARLEVYDILGRMVESRDLGWLPAGEGRLDFDGSGLASGVYFYRLSTDTAALTKKMILLK
jgi:hypothetical protein